MLKESIDLWASLYFVSPMCSRVVTMDCNEYRFFFRLVQTIPEFGRFQLPPLQFLACPGHLGIGGLQFAIGLKQRAVLLFEHGLQLLERAVPVICDALR